MCNSNVTCMLKLNKDASLNNHKLLEAETSSFCTAAALNPDEGSPFVFSCIFYLLRPRVPQKSPCLIFNISWVTSVQGRTDRSVTSALVQGPAACCNVRPWRPSFLGPGPSVHYSWVVEVPHAARTYPWQAGIWHLSPWLHLIHRQSPLIQAN